MRPHPARAKARRDGKPLPNLGAMVWGKMRIGRKEFVA
jgi:hypothetical protein